MSTPQRDRSRPATGLAWGAIVIGSTGILALLVSRGCGGALSQRSIQELAGRLPIGQGVAKVRVELEDGSIEVDSGSERAIVYRGGVRRAADTAEELARLQHVPVELTAAPDPADPTILIVRGPERVAGSTGVFAYELRLTLPPELALVVKVHNNGAITVAHRAAATEVETGRGDLRFPSCSGGLRGKTGNGSVIAFDHRGDLDLRTKVGDMQALVAEPGDSIRLVTGQGTIQCIVPAELDFEVDARAEIGRAGAKGFGLTSEQVGEFGAVLTGVRGTGRTKIVLRTGSGHISLAPPR